MDFNATIDLIIKDLREASDIIDDLKKYPGVPVLQVEMAKLKCRSAGEVIAMLKTLTENATVVEKEPVQQKKVHKEPVKTEEKAPSVQEVIVQAPVEESAETDDFEIEPIPDETDNEVTASKTEVSPVVNEIASKKPHTKEHESPILADRFNSLSSTFHDQMGIKKNEDDISDVLKSQPINSLREAIGLNDKFIFIFEIFNGNQAEYNQAISRLESAESLEDAKAVIMSYTGENTESEAVLQLLELVKRKFHAHE